MNILDSVKTAATPLWLRVLPYAVGVVVLFGVVSFGLLAAYYHGVDITQAKADQTISAIHAGIEQANARHAKAKADLLEEMREKDQANADAMAAIDARHQKEIADREAISNRTIADLRSGALSLRDKFTTCQRAAHSGSAQAGTSTGSCDGPASLNLQVEDAQLFILWATEADRVADQLRAAQAIIAADRKGQSKP